MKKINIIIALSAIVLLTNVTSAGAATNLINNPSVEQAASLDKTTSFLSARPLGWNKSHDVKNISFFYYPDLIKGYNSPKAVKVQVFYYRANKEGWYFDKVNINSAKQYTFSDYYTSTTANYISATFQLADGSSVQTELGKFQKSSQWQKASAIINPPAGAVSVTIMHYLKSIGSLATDEYSLTENEVIPPPPPPPPATGPQISIQDPAAGATLSHTILIKSTASATNPNTITQVQFYVDDSPILNPVLTPPYQIVLDTTQFSDGPHILSAVATDNQQNKSDKASVSVNFSNTIAANPNLISNPSLENGTTGDITDWLNSSWGTNDAVSNYPVTGHTGNGASITIANYTSGDAKWYFKDVNVLPGIQYVFSDFYNSNVPTAVVARYTLADGSVLYGQMGATTASADWTKFTASFVTPDNAVSVTIFHIIQSVGTLSVDDFYLGQANSLPFDQGMVSLNFDDGVPSFYANGLPILTSHGIKSTDYIISGELGNSDSITVAQMLNLQSLGHEIGDHTKTHADLTTLTQPQIVDEVLNSKTDLQALGIDPITTFSYPYGTWNNLADQVVKQSGYLGARTALVQDGGPNYRDGNPFLIRTRSVEKGTTLADVKNWINQAIADKTWTVLVFHGIDNTGDQYSTTPAQFNAIANYITANNVKTVTNSQGVYLMTHK